MVEAATVVVVGSVDAGTKEGCTSLTGETSSMFFFFSSLTISSRRSFLFSFSWLSTFSMVA